jgi:hypothetical protein
MPDDQKSEEIKDSVLSPVVGSKAKKNLEVNTKLPKSASKKAEDIKK